MLLSSLYLVIAQTIVLSYFSSSQLHSNIFPTCIVILIFISLHPKLLSVESDKINKFSLAGTYPVKSLGCLGVAIGEGGRFLPASSVYPIAL